MVGWSCWIEHPIHVVVSVMLVTLTWNAIITAFVNNNPKIINNILRCDRMTFIYFRDGCFIRRVVVTIFTIIVYGMLLTSSGLLYIQIAIWLISRPGIDNNNICINLLFTGHGANDWMNMKVYTLGNRKPLPIYPKHTHRMCECFVWVQWGVLYTQTLHTHESQSTVAALRTFCVNCCGPPHSIALR